MNRDETEGGGGNAYAQTGHSELVERLAERARNFILNRTETMEVWGAIRRECLRDKGSLPRDMFENLVCGIEEEYHDALREAAAALTAQAAEIERLRKALATIVGVLDDPTGGTHVADMRAASALARAALEPGRQA